MNKIKTKIIALLALLVMLLTTGFSCKWVGKPAAELIKPITLTYWRVWDNEDAFDEIIAAYQAIHPNITIQYRKLRYEEYEKTLIDALAEDRGPDIFSIHNTWVNKYRTKIKPLPDEITLAYQTTKGTIKKETVIESRTTATLSLRALKNDFVDAVYGDAVWPDDQRQDRIYGLPLSVDTMALFYNRDLFNNAGIPEPAKYWDQFQEDVKKLTVQDKQGNFVQSGAAIGASANVSRSFDLISLLMMQNGAQMADAYNNAYFHQIPQGQKRQTSPGEEALIFYTDFASPAKMVYGWNEAMPNSLDAFNQGKTAMFFGYAFNLPSIKSPTSKLNFSIAKMPQIDGNPEINFANYWVETVSAKSKNSDAAWDFIQFSAKAENVSKYLAKAKKPTALRSLVSTQLEDMELGTFASQVLTAKSWYRGKDAAAAEQIFSDMVEAVLTGALLPKEAISQAAKKITQTNR